MIDSLKRPPGALRWAPRQRFGLSPAGNEARSGREQAIASARIENDSGRQALDEALARWAQPLGIEPGDGVYLEEFTQGLRTVSQVAESLADCGTSKPEVQAAADRLYKAGLLDPDPPAPEPRPHGLVP
jgi:hypothetical protein